MTKEELRENLKQSMLAKDTEKTNILRLILSALTYYEIEKGGAGYEATEDDILTVIQKQVKQRHDSIEQFQAANRQDLVDKEKKELDLLTQFLPAQMSEEEIKALIKETIRKTNASSIQDMGKVMGKLAPLIKGKADGSIVSKLVKQELTG